MVDLYDRPRSPTATEQTPPPHGNTGEQQHGWILRAHAVSSIRRQRQANAHTASSRQAKTPTRGVAAQPPPLVAWKEPIKHHVTGHGRHAASSSCPASVRRRRRGHRAPSRFTSRTTGNLIMIGTGQQHWPTVHTADLANSSGTSSSPRPPEAANRQQRSNSSVAELTDAAAVAAGARRVPVQTTKLGLPSATSSPKYPPRPRATTTRPRASSAGEQPRGRLPPRELPQVTSSSLIDEVLVPTSMRRRRRGTFPSK